MNREVSRDLGDDSDVAPVRSPSRRVVLLGVGGLGAATAAAALAACGASSPSDGSGSGGSGGGGTDGGTGGQASNDLGSTSAIPVGGGKVFPDQVVVVTQPDAGTFKAFTATCTHEGCTVNRVANGLIMCPCHGSEYSITDGSVKQGPAVTPLPSKKITVANGQITLD
jgi:Rieske Fe-S protein